MSASTTTAPFSRAVTNAMRRLYPEELADKTFDNTGLLLESPLNPRKRQKNSVLLTIDLTKAVADEAIRRKDSIVVAYHPIIFRGLKSLTLGNSQQQSLLRLAAEGISVYSPHTAVDCQKGGLGDWLADIVTGLPTGSQRDVAPSQINAPDSERTSKSSTARPSYQLQHHPSQLSLHENTLSLGTNRHHRYPIVPTTVPNAAPGSGMGRIVRFDESIPLTSVIDRIGLGLGNPKGIPIAIPQGQVISDILVSSIGICAGSGGSLFSTMEKNGEDVDLLLTGELSHHEALAQIEQGRCVICLFHSNTERGFLHTVMKPELEQVLQEEWDSLRTKEKAKAGVHNDVLESLEDAAFEIHVSEVDRDPYGIMIAKTDGE